jgi:hypothetical protein
VDADTGRGESLSVEDTGPAAPGQEEIWLSCALEGDASPFAVSIVIELQGSPNVPLFEQALGALAARHEALRTTYDPGVDGLVQKVGRPGPVSLALCDVSALDDEAANTAAAAIHADEARRRFDVQRGPIFRATLIKRAAGRFTCLFTVHHIAIDGWSMGVFARDLEAIHAAYHRGEPPALHPLALRYLDFARQQKARAAAKVREEALEEIRERFRVAPLIFPMEKKSAAGAARHSDHVKRLFPPRLNQRITACGREVKATRFAIFTAVLWMVLHAWSRRASFVMASDYANRSEPESGAVMGLFVSQILLKATIDPKATFLDVIRLAQRELQQALRHADCPVSALLPHGPDVKAAPPFRVKLAFQPRIDYPRLVGVEVMGVDVRSEWAKFDLLFSVHTDADLTSWDLQFRASMFDKPDMIAMLEDLESLTSRAIDRPAATVESLLGETPALRARQATSRLGALKRDLLDAVVVDAPRAAHAPPAATESAPMRGIAAGRLTPWLVRACVRGVSLRQWAAANKTLIEERVREHGAVLFRDFHVSAAEFQDVSAELIGDLMNYVEGATPREKKSAWTYSSTQFPQQADIHLHNELSSAMTFPGRIAFYCVKPAASGGHTPLADVHDVYAQAPAAIRAPFEQDGWMLVRNFQKGFGLSWRQAFATDDPRVVEDYCRTNDIEHVWESDGHLRMRQVRSAVLTHPFSRLPVWFNHVAFWHESSLDPDLRAMLLGEYGRDGLPFNTYYADGSPITDDDAEQIRAAYRRATISFPWRSNDLLYLDNIGVAHGRTAYTGEREVLVSMGRPQRREQLR